MKIEERMPIQGGDICTAFRVRLDNGHAAFYKTLDSAPAGFFEAESKGLRWLARASGGPAVPDVLDVTPEGLLLSWIESGEPTARAAEEFGRALAAMHRAGAPVYGAPWPGFIGSLPLDNTPGDDWPRWYAERRVLPYLRMAVDRGAVDESDRQAIERACSGLRSTEPAPSRIHGDLWNGNIVWAANGTVWLVDPAAHGGHRETDLAMLQLFGAPYLERILAAYDEAFPLAEGWQRRVGIHQAHPLLVHAVLFGGGYGKRAARVCAASAW